MDPFFGKKNDVNLIIEIEVKGHRCVLEIPL